MKMSDDDERLLSRDEVAKRYGVHPKTLDTLVKEKRVPQPVDQSPVKENRWLLSEVVADLKSRRKRELQEQVQ